jgi:diketogulonate reductase-like aldo/keto reductase
MDTTVEIRGTRVPAIGFGTWQLTGTACVAGVRDALELGYRHIDTARMYGNEREVGEGLRQSGVAREEVFITTKVWRDDAAPHRVRASCEGSLTDLGVDRVDLLLLHWPNPSVPLADTLEAMDVLRDEGLTARYGVSNFDAELLRDALDVAPPLFCDQVPFSPLRRDDEVLEIAQEADLLVTAYSPLGRGAVLRNPVLREIGARHGKSAGQVALRWLLDQPNTCVIPKASSHAPRAENFEIFDFALDDDERARIEALGRVSGGA